MLSIVRWIERQRFGCALWRAENRVEHLGQGVQPLADGPEIIQAVIQVDTTKRVKIIKTAHSKAN